MIRLLLALAMIALATRADAADKMTIILDWFVNPDHAPIIVAAEKGYFAEAGLDLEIVPPADPSDPPKLVAAGRAELAVSYQPTHQIQVAEGLPLVRIATLISTPLNSVVVLADGPIKSIKDLKGRKVGFSVAGTEEAVLGTILEKHGLTLKDVEMVNVNFALTPALLTGRVAAVTGAYRNFELNQLAIEGKPGRAFHVEEEGVPVYDELIVVANKDKLADPRLKRFVTALERGVMFLTNNPDESWKLFVARHKDLDDELNKRAWRDTLPRFDKRPAAMDNGRYQRFAKFLQDKGLVKAMPPVASYAVELP
ncbi:MAG: ABC transporter substrate-binding protein [Alphaproteobacteria bacterium]|nr:ABC transporter substrate-binding protein [Alphaproteobacteria bacterium]